MAIGTHRITWWVYAGTALIRHTSTMRGLWSYEATCSCGGLQTKTGGATRGYIAQLVWEHKRG